MNDHSSPGRRLLISTVVAITVKFLSAPIMYLMFVLLARAMAPEEYVKFAFAFSLVLIMAKVGAAGQQELLLKVLPGLESEESRPHWHAATKFALTVMVLISSLTTILLMGGSYIVGNAHYMIVASLLVPLLAFSELQTSILRVRGSVFAALAPRDILWRLTLAVPALLVWFFKWEKFSATTVFLWAAATLSITLLFQMRSDWAVNHFKHSKAKRTNREAVWSIASWHFSISSVLAFAAPPITVVAIGAALSLEQTGPFFAALRTAQLLQFFLLAANIVATPAISRHFAKGEMEQVQNVCRTVAAISGLASVFGLIFLVLFGKTILALFGPSFEVAYPQLIILAIGFAINALSGPNGALLQMTGHEKIYTRIVLIVNGVSITAAFPAAYYGGVTAVAINTTLALIAWNMLAYYQCLKRVKLDPGIFSIFRRNRGQAR